ncbi:MAG: hydrogenase formation protein HypD [Gammaproteobacteria bacterium]|nr:hydrogenase formation protein HypD [Gammaproteobacteria bacterium]
MTSRAKQWLEQIHQLPLTKKIRIMNVCGGHERTISHAGLRSVLPETIELIPGPGCPVCVCPEEDIYTAIQLALNEPVTLVTFGDMLRVPVNVPHAEIRTMEQARAAGADIRAIASPTEAVKLAHDMPYRQLVFFAAGFETTMAPVAAMVAEGLPDNLLLLNAGRLTWPAVAMLLASESAGFDALIAPGHVSAVMGSEQWQFVVDQYSIATAVAGFTADSLLAALYSTLRQLLDGRLFLDNAYPEVVTPGGNVTAKKLLHEVFDIDNANWRGIGEIPASGYALKSQFDLHNARKQFALINDASRKHAGTMPAGCDCARVVLGKIYPNQCKLYGLSCKPRQPVGPCMVSDEGACRIWWANGVREQAKIA